MRFKLPELSFEYMDPLIQLNKSIIECGLWVEKLPKDIQPYAIDAIVKVGTAMHGQRGIEANRRIFIRMVLNEMMATAHDHMSRNTTNSALLRIIE